LRQSHRRAASANVGIARRGSRGLLSLLEVVPAQLALATGDMESGRRACTCPDLPNARVDRGDEGGGRNVLRAGVWEEALRVSSGCPSARDASRVGGPREGTRKPSGSLR